MLIFVSSRLRGFCCVLVCMFAFISINSEAFAAAPRQAAERNDMLAAASVDKGHDLSMACNVCHTFDRGGPDKTGPNLFGIVGAKHAHESGYAYSDILQNMHDRTWTVDALDKWIRNPAAYAPRTKMTFSGFLDPQDRADLIAYLMTLK